MVAQFAEVEWEGDFKSGRGRIKRSSGAYPGAYSYSSRFEAAEGTNPEELIGAAEAGCFSMAFSLGLTKIGHPPKSIRIRAKVHLNQSSNGFAIDKIELETEADVPGLDAKVFKEQITLAKEGCPVSKALSGKNISITALLKQIAPLGRGGLNAIVGTGGRELR